MIKIQHIYLRHLVLALLTLALLSVPFAHRAGAAPVTQQMSMFLSAGGSLDDICGGTGGHVNSGCESCRITATLLMPPAAQSVQPASLPVLILADAATLSITAPMTPYLSPLVRAPPMS